MLGTRLILLAMNDFPEANADTEAEVVAVANHQIPIFWLLAFSVADIRCFPVGEGEDAIVTHPAGSEYPLLVAKREALVARLSQRYKLLEPFLCGKDAELLQAWLGFLAQQSAAVLALDTYELWLTKSEAGSLLQELEGQLSIFEKLAAAPDSVLTDLKSSALWQSENSISLAGYGWS